MNRKNINKIFDNIGSRVTFRNARDRSERLSTPALLINIAVDRKGEHFSITINSDVDESNIEIQMLDCNQDLKHMLLHVRYPRLINSGAPDNRKLKLGNVFVDKLDPWVNEKLLLGHDEMHWFVAGVSSSTSIKQAFDNLRPKEVTRMAMTSGVDPKKLYKRKNKGFIRQGEWFFVPVDFTPDRMTVIHKNEPINRTGGKPHYVEEVVRSGGTTVYTWGDSGRAISEAEFTKLPIADRANYKMRRQDARVLARGKVVHPDHKTIVLGGWHQVFLSNEVNSRGTSNAFID